MRTKVILDVDTGSDDAIAMILAMMSPKLEVIGVCSVNGNREVCLTTDNTLRVCELLESDVPVYPGCEYPMVATLRPGGGGGTPIREGTYDGLISLIHGDHLPLPAPTTKTAQTIPAVVYYVQTLMAATEKVTIVAVGPLTNLAMAMRVQPKICEKIEKIVIMGGGYLINNDTPTAEFNIWVDPEAAEIVMRTGEEFGLKIVWVPLDATHVCYMSKDDAAHIRTFGNKMADAVADFIEMRATGYVKDADMKELEASPVHDALAVAYLLDEEVLEKVAHVNMHVVTGGGYADGMTCLDMRELLDKPAPNCYFALSANRDKFLKVLYGALGEGTVYSK